ncbi:Synaptopodin 2-like protein [Eumeta japonica]|uniref:Synaptopodin 2-like protein n=1 Tax=Eumeta variegata TaxID=151549 RepID=A0A4C1V9D3_EUMVA|nr:Synaptopodin 2-like protein [Eumeta japonica]
MSTREVELTGGAPWGFRMHGGADQNQPLRISRWDYKIQGRSAANEGGRGSRNYERLSRRAARPPAKRTRKLEDVPAMFTCHHNSVVAASTDSALAPRAAVGAASPADGQDAMLINCRSGGTNFPYKTY